LTYRLFAAALSGIACSVATASSPLTLSYRIETDPLGTYVYRFTLTLDNHDASWERGQGFGWLVFGDGCGDPSPLWDFWGDPGTIDSGPWTSFVATAGHHNGPSLGGLRNMWFPSTVGESISWSGTSSVFGADSLLRWSCLVTRGRAGPIESERALYVTRCGPADINADGYLDGADFDRFVRSYNEEKSEADLDRSGFVNPDDWEAFFNAFDVGC